MSVIDALTIGTMHSISLENPVDSDKFESTGSVYNASITTRVQPGR